MWWCAEVVLCCAALAIESARRPHPHPGPPPEGEGMQGLSFVLGWKVRGRRARTWRLPGRMLIMRGCQLV